ncbi:tRNA (adenosine(37)-N6)-threonylcarbamoyltransferase complex dimerization subunit type 1 TsaB [Flavobacteriales bacterium]|jgi:tRNA threonylcarbamoyladenosine biosynthesis protein TsaB|nr:tRNA (adenosine(37)-N6)-threonylcarbamoyltransferase complex dimerization subunit type 1 TsaB [Flavobacteriales bacterium]
MALILTLDTATKNCSLALCDNGIILESIDHNKGSFSHSEKLHVFIEELFTNTGKKLSELDAVAVSKGPGSYTGLRIGVSTAKGLCFGLGIPLISVETLEVLTRTFLLEHSVNENDILIPMIDARRMEVYTAIFNTRFTKLEETKALILEPTSFDQFLETSACHFIGDGAEKSSNLYQGEHQFFYPEIYPSSKAVAKLVELKYQSKEFEDVAYFEPYYLKDFVDGKKTP